VADLSHGLVLFFLVEETDQYRKHKQCADDKVKIEAAMHFTLRADKVFLVQQKEPVEGKRKADNITGLVVTAYHHQIDDDDIDAHLGSWYHQVSGCEYSLKLSPK
jgi:hypothetical protein